MIRILVTGATRGVGLETVWQALEAGYEVRALARSASGIEFKHRHLEKIDADATDAEVMKSAVSGCDAVITCVGTGPTREEVHLYSDAAAAAIEAMQEVGVRRLIAITGLGAGDSKGVGGFLYSKLLQPIMLGTIYVDKDREENLIRSSGLDWTIVRPGILTRLPKKGRYKVLVDRSQWRGGFISRGDVADFLIRQVEDERLVHETPMIIAG